MPHSDYWPFTANVDLNGESSLLQKQLDLMEGEVKDIKMELAAIKRNRSEQLGRQQSPREVSERLATALRQGSTQHIDNEADDELLKENTAEFGDTELLNTLQVRRGEPGRPQGPRPRQDARPPPPPDTERVPHEESRMALDEEIIVLKNQMRDMADEMEELKIGAMEKSEQLEEYRAKYLRAQQEAEELRRQLELLDFDNRQVSDQIQLEIQKMKVQFQAKLQELAPLPELLAGARAQLLEARQLQALAEENARALGAESRLVHDKLAAAAAALGQERAERARAADEAGRLQQQLAERSAEIDRLTASLDDYKSQVVRLEERASSEAAERRRLAARLAAAAGAAAAARGAAAALSAVPALALHPARACLALDGLRFDQ